MSPRWEQTLEERFWAKVDKNGPGPDPKWGAEGRCWKWMAAHSPQGYSRFDGPEGDGNAHRASYILNVGPIPSGHYIDHICHNRGCINPEHLRPVTNKQNMENLTDLQKNNTSGYHGVHWDKSRQRWSARVKHNYQQINLGRFDLLEDAVEAVRLKRLELFTHNDLDRAA